MVSSLSIRFFKTFVLGVTACSFINVGAHGRTIRLNWTAEGVREYTRYVKLSLHDIKGSALKPAVASAHRLS